MTGFDCMPAALSVCAYLPIRLSACMPVVLSVCVAVLLPGWVYFSLSALCLHVCALITLIARLYVCPVAICRFNLNTFARGALRDW